MSMKTILNHCSTIVKAPFIAIKAIVKVIAAASGYVYKACDHIVSGTVHGYTHIVILLKGKDKNKHQYRLFRKLFWASIIVIILAIASFITRESMFFVPVGGGSVVTRFGAYNRETGTGLHFRIPLVERYYVVNIGFVKQANFGFIQVNPPIRHQLLTDDERKSQTAYEKELLRKEADNDVFAEKGDVTSGLQQQQRLTHDYLREMHGYGNTLTIPEALAILKRNQQEIRTLKRDGFTVNGRMPLRSKSRLITKDLNLVRLHWTLQYQIQNMRDYLFNSRDVQQNIHDISIGKMSAVIGSHNYAQILTTARQSIEKETMKSIQTATDKLHLGVKITQIIIVDAIPIQEVEFAFQEVNRAAQEKEKLIYQAQQDYFRVIPEAKGKASEIKNTAHAYALELTNKAKGKASQFDQIVKAYLKAPSITNDRLYIEAMESFLAHSSSTIIDPKIQGILPIFTGDGLKNIKQQLRQGGAIASTLQPETATQPHRLNHSEKPHVPTTNANTAMTIKSNSGAVLLHDKKFNGIERTGDEALQKSITQQAQARAQSRHQSTKVTQP